MYSVVPCGCTAIGGIPSCEVYIGLTSTVHAAAGPLLNISLCALSLAWGALPQSSQKVLPLLSPPLGGVLVVERLPLPKGQRDERVPEAAQLPPLQLCGARRRARFFQEVARPIHLQPQNVRHEKIRVRARYRMEFRASVHSDTESSLKQGSYLERAIN